MALQKTAAIILHSVKSGEADIIATVLTQNDGKRKFIFKGIRKSRRRARSATQIGTVLELSYYSHENKNMHIANEFTIQTQHEVDNVLDNVLDKYYHLCTLLEVVNKTTGFNHHEYQLYELLIAGIETLVANNSTVHVSAFFLVHLLRFHGILPDFRYCKGCGASDFTVFVLDDSDLTPLCKNCTNSSLFLSKAVKSFLFEILQKKFSMIDMEKYDNASILDLLFYLIRFIEHYFHITIKSKEFVLKG